MTRPTILRGALVLAVVFAGNATIDHAAISPQLINYQGVLRDSSGAPIDAPGGIAMTFRFLDSDGGGCPASGGTLLVTDTHAAVPVAGGLFDVLLGSGSLSAGSVTTLADAFLYHTAVFLEIEVSGEVLCPRTRIVSAAYAVNGARESDGELNLFVDGSGGDDANDGLSGASAKATIMGAVTAIPVVLNGDVNIRIQAGTYNEEVVLSDRLRNGPYWVRLVHDTIDPLSDAPSVVIGPPVPQCVTCIGLSVLDELVEVQGLTISGFQGPDGVGLLASGGTNVTALNSVFSNNNVGLVSTDGHFVELGEGCEILGNIEAGLQSVNHGTIEVNEPVTFCDNATSAGVAAVNSAIRIEGTSPGCTFCPTDGPMVASLLSSIDTDGSCSNFSCSADSSSVCGAPGGGTSAVCVDGVSIVTCPGCGSVCANGVVAGGWFPSVCSITAETGSCSANPLGLGTCCCVCAP